MALRIMAVDDEPGVLRLFKAILEPLGAEVLTMVDSREASERLNREKFDGIFIDARMPHLDGFELARRIRASGPNSQVPIVMLTGLDDVETMRKGFQAGITFFLGKPISQERLHYLFNAMRGGMLREQRRHMRLPLRMTVNCRSGEKGFRADCLNIGEEGMLLEPSGGLQVGADLELDFRLPNTSGPFGVRAKVARKEAPERIAVQFTDLMPEELSAIQGYITGVEGRKLRTLERALERTHRNGHSFRETNRREEKAILPEISADGRRAHADL